MSDLHQHTNKEVLDGITTEKVTSWDNKSDFSGDYNDLANKPNIPTQTSELVNDSNYVTENKISEIKEELNNKADISDLHQHTNKEVLDGITANKVTSWDNKSDFSGSYNDLTNKPSIPTKTSELVNDSNFAMKTDLNSKVDKVEGKSLISDTEIERLANVTNYDDTEIKEELNNKANLSDLHQHDNKAVLDGITEAKVISWDNKSDFSGSYNDLTNKPNIPTKTSQLTNDSSFLTSVPSEYITETELEAKGYLTEHQSLSNYATKDELHSHDNKKVLDGITTEKVTSWDNKSDFDGNYNNLTNKPSIPTKMSELENDSNFTTNSYVDEMLGGKRLVYLTQAEYDILTEEEKNNENVVYSITDIDIDYVTEEELNNKEYATQIYVSTKIAEAQLNGGEVDLSAYATKDDLKTKIDYEIDVGSGIELPVVFDGSYNSLTDKPEIPSLEGYATETYVANAIAEAQLSGGEVDLNNYATKDELHNHNNKAVLDNITEAKITSWDNKSNFSGNYNDLTNKPNIPSLDGYATKDELHTHDNKAVLDGITATKVTSWDNKSNFSGSYNDLTNKPTIPTQTSQLTNNSGFLTSIPSEYITESELEANGYTTQTYVDNKITTINNQIGALTSLSTTNKTDLVQAINELYQMISKIINPPIETENYGEITISTTTMNITEGNSASFTVKLASAPTNNQFVSLSVNNSDCVLNETSLTFTPSNYNTAQTIQVSISEDLDYSDETATITITSPNVSTKTITVNITDNDIEPTDRITSELVVPQLMSVVNDGDYSLSQDNYGTITDFSATSNNYYMSTSGSDSNDGTSRNTPLKTLEGFKTKIEASSLTEANLFIEDGEYIILDRFDLYGTKFGNSCKVNIRGIGDNVEFTGAVTLDNSKFTATTMNGVTVYQYDLSDYDLNYTPGTTTSIWDNKYGNFADMPFIIMNGEKSFVASYPHKYGICRIGNTGETSGTNGFSVTIPEGDVRTAVNSWSNIDNNVFLHIYYTVQYVGYPHLITSYSSTTNKVTCSGSKPYDMEWGAATEGYFDNPSMKARFLNVKEQLTEENEYWIDFTNKKLYLIPPSGYTISNTKIQLAFREYGTNTQGVFYGSGTNVNVVFDRINFSGFRSRIFSSGLGNIKFYKCTLKNSSDSIFDCSDDSYSNIEFRMCKIGKNNGNGINITTGDRTTLTNGNCKIYNCTFNDSGYAYFNAGYVNSLKLTGCGSEVKGNKFSTNPGILAEYWGNNFIFDDNVFYNAHYESGDSGTLYSGRDWTFRGNEITNNIFIAGLDQDQQGENCAVYLDDCFSSALVDNNSITGYQLGIQMGGGRDNIITNNTMTDCRHALSADARGTESGADLSELMSNLSAVPYNGTLYQTAYPAIATLSSSSSNNGLPYGNTIKDNVAINCVNGFTIDSKVISNSGTVSNNTTDGGPGGSGGDTDVLLPDFSTWTIENSASATITTMSGNNIEIATTAEDGNPYTTINLLANTTYEISFDEMDSATMIAMYDSSWAEVLDLRYDMFTNKTYSFTPTTDVAIIALANENGTGLIKITNFTILKS